MVVEDNQDILFQIELILDLNGYEVTSTLNGEEALELLFQMERLPDLILSDIIMPKMDGYDFFKELSLISKYRNIPFIFTSAKSTPHDIRLGKLIGAEDYITKPFKEKELLDIIQEQLNKAKLLNIFEVKIKEALESVKNTIAFSESIIIKEKYYLYLMVWDSKDGLTLHNSFPEQVNKTSSVKTISSHVLNIFNELKKERKIELPESILIELPHFNKQGFFYCDMLFDSDIEREFIIALIGPDLNYFKSLKLKNIFASIAAEFKTSLQIDLKSSWDNLFNAVNE